MRKLLAFAILGTIGVAGSIMMNSTTEEAASIPSRTRPMEKAILTGEIDPVRRLLEAGENIDQPMFNDETPAIMAATTNDWTIVLYLLERGADPAAEDLGGVSVARVAEISRLAAGTEDYDALQRVKEILRARGLMP